MTKHFPTVNVGVDVGKSQLDLYLLERGRAMTIPNEEPDISNLIRALRRFRIERIVVEATGRLEQPFVGAALAARQASHPRRTCSISHRPLPQRDGRHSLQPRYQALLRTPAQHRQAQKGRAHRLHSKNRDGTQRHAPRQRPLALSNRLTQHHSRLLGDTSRALKVADCCLRSR